MKLSFHIDPFCYFFVETLLYQYVCTFDNIFMLDCMRSSFVCSHGSAIDMCPLCDVNCGFWKLSDSCQYAKITYLFSNNFTVIFAFLMSVWGKLVVHFYYHLSTYFICIINL